MKVTSVLLCGNGVTPLYIDKNVCRRQCQLRKGLCQLPTLCLSAPELPFNVLCAHFSPPCCLTQDSASLVEGPEGRRGLLWFESPDQRFLCLKKWFLFRVLLEKLWVLWEVIPGWETQTIGVGPLRVIPISKSALALYSWLRRCKQASIHARTTEEGVPQ